MDRKKKDNNVLHCAINLNKRLLHKLVLPIIEFEEPRIGYAQFKQALHLIMHLIWNKIQKGLLEHIADIKVKTCTISGFVENVNIH